MAAKKIRPSASIRAGVKDARTFEQKRSDASDEDKAMRALRPVIPRTALDEVTSSSLANALGGLCDQIGRQALVTERLIETFNRHNQGTEHMLVSLDRQHEISERMITAIERMTSAVDRLEATGREQAEAMRLVAQEMESARLLLAHESNGHGPDNPIGLRKNG